MPHGNLHFVPILLGVLFPITFIGTYIAAVAQDHVYPDLPFISRAGSAPPESCFFGQLLNIIAAIMCVCVLLRHRQLQAQPPPYRPPARLLRATLYSGWSAALGVSMVGNFQLDNMLIMHVVGAFLAFGMGVVFFWLQVQCTRYDPPDQYDARVVRLRIILAFLNTLFFVLTLVFCALARFTRGERPNMENYYGPGWSWTVIGAACEWIMAAHMTLFIASFAREFRHISISTPKVIVTSLARSDSDDSNNLQHTNFGFVPV